MIHRKFNALKFRRTFIGGSKREETRLFLEVQGTKEDNSECNWLEYRRMLREYCDDKLNILLSWIYLMKNLRWVFGAISAVLIPFNLLAALIIFLLATSCHALYWHLKCLEVKRLTEYGFSLDVINEQTGLDLAKN